MTKVSIARRPDQRPEKTTQATSAYFSPVILSLLRDAGSDPRLSTSVSCPVGLGCSSVKWPCGRWWLGLGGSESLVDGSGDAALEGRTALPAITLGVAPLVVGLAWARQAQLGGGDAVQGGVQLAVATS
jgi:hypothetical protein